MTVRLFLKRALMDHGEPSSSRILMWGSTVMSWLWVSYYLIKTEHLPDAGAWGGIAAFCTSSYLVNRATVAYEKKKDS